MPNLNFRSRALIALAILTCAAGSRAGTVTGTVHNGTSGKPGAGLDVVLIQLEGGMQPVATTKTDADGNFQFDRPAIGAAPMLLRVPYRGVNYHEPLPPDRSTAEVLVYEPTDKPESVAISGRVLFLRPEGAKLKVDEEYTVENHTQPPVAYFRSDGTFRFALPEGGQLGQVSAWGSSAMPVVQGTIDKGKNVTAIAFPFRPGENGVQVTYEVPYPSNQATLRFLTDYSVSRMAVAAPPAVEVKAEGFSLAGSRQGWNLYVRDAVPAGARLAIEVSGTASPASASAAEDDALNPSVNSRAVAQGEPATALPARLDSLKWILVAGFAGLFALGGLHLWRRSQLQPAGAHAASFNREAGHAAKREPMPLVEREVQGSIDELKDTLFRLELRRQAGTITEADYARERGRIEQTLRNLVKG